MLAVFPMDQGATTTVALNNPVSNMTSSTSTRSTHFAATTSDSNTIINMKYQDGPAQTSSEATTLTSSSHTLSSSRKPPTTTAGSKTTTCDSVTMTNKGITVAHMTKQEFYGKTGGGNRRPEKKIVNPANNKAKAKGRGKGKAPEEPVILTLSSDEDEDKPGGGSGPSASGISGSPQPGSHTGAHLEPVNHKEPIITADMEDLEEPEKSDSGAVTGGGIPDIQSLNDGTLKGPYTSLQCRSLRIGSYKVMPKERVLIVPQGLRIEVPPIAEGKFFSISDI
ncbi:hypothetical protein E2C01_008556 [Portunus trituberculatus]|uniref:Uncharacterized protein n=1 Tax=Portunus trituberculatus TaxID=210409 RepID=A0A5B7D359_PORTR|nr:hypothetical protein [Portunus trituberculatus]